MGSCFTKNNFQPIITLKRSKSRHRSEESRPNSSSSPESVVQFETKSNSKSFYFVNPDKNNLQPDSSELLRSLLSLKSIYDCRRAYRSQSRSSSMNRFLQTRLFRDQSLSKTRTNKPVAISESGKRVKMLSRRGVKNMCQSGNLTEDISLLMKPPFVNLDMIVPGIYQTAITGIVFEDLVEARIQVIINVTYEMPLISHPGFVSFRVPVEDDGSEPIHEYFDDVADLMEAARLHGNGVVVHCMAGVSRSATMVLAYMIKYTTISLLEAFLHAKLIRSPIRPNIGFLQQLMQYEMRIKGRCSVEFEEILVKPSSDGEFQIKSATSKESNSFVKVTLPKFYRHYFPELYKREIRRQILEQTKTNEQQDQTNQPARLEPNNPGSPVPNKSNTRSIRRKKTVTQRRSSRDRPTE